MGPSGASTTIGMAHRSIVVLEPRAAEVARLEARLAALGFADRVICRDGREAFDHVTAGRDPAGPAPSAILIDIDASIADGAEFARRIRTCDQTASIPVVLLTAHPSISLKVAAARLGAQLVSASSEHGDLPTLGVALGVLPPAGAAA